jgi:hypothetical protein
MGRITFPTVRYKLASNDGNGFLILMLIRRIMERAGYSESVIERLMHDAPGEMVEITISFVTDGKE